MKVTRTLGTLVAATFIGCVPAENHYHTHITQYTQQDAQSYDTSHAHDTNHTHDTNHYHDTEHTHDTSHSHDIPPPQVTVVVNNKWEEKYVQKPNLVVSSVYVDGLTFNNDYSKANAVVLVQFGNNGYSEAKNVDVKVSYNSIQQIFPGTDLKPGEYKGVAIPIEVTPTSPLEITARVDSLEKILEVNENDNSKCIDLGNDECNDKLPNFIVKNVVISNVSYANGILKGEYSIVTTNNGFKKTILPVDLRAEIRHYVGFNECQKDKNENTYKSTKGEKFQNHVIPGLLQNESIVTNGSFSFEVPIPKGCEKLHSFEIEIDVEVDYSDKILEITEYDNDDYADYEN